MANDLNYCSFIGRLGKDPASRALPSGEDVCNFDIAVGSSWKEKTSGEKKESTVWVPIVVFGKLAGVCAQYLRKGSKVFVSGRFQVRKWTDKEGKDRYNTEIIASSMQMLDSKPAGAAGGQPEKPAPATHAAAPDDDQDIPFATRESVW